MKIPVSFLIPVKNEADNLPRCLDAIGWADEVFVVDSQSTDATVHVAQKHGAKLVQFEFNGTWPKKKNWSLENLPFAHDWVFILDADEVLPPETADEIRSIVEAPQHDIDGYWINRRFRFMGKWLRHAYYPNWNLRFFRHRLGRYEKITGEATASGDNEVHEHVVVKGRTGRLRSEMDHFAFPDIATFVEKHNRYSNWEARVAFAQHLDSAKPQHTRVNWRRRLKLASQRLPFRPTLRFCYVYFWQRGFLDGREGFIFARLHAFYEFLSVVKTRELAQNRPSTPPSSSEGPASSSERILGVDFFTGTSAEAVEAALRGSLVLAPSGPGLAEDLIHSPEYRRALENADLNLTDSGFLLLLWRRYAGRELPRLSGLAYLKTLLKHPTLQKPGAIFWVLPSQPEANRNRQWMRAHGFPIQTDDQYVAPHYGAGPLNDPALVERIRIHRPSVVIVAIGGGVQERLGLALKESLTADDHVPGIVCIGAALAFINGGQVNIPPWADRLLLGWLFRILSNPPRYLGRYWRARGLAGLVKRWGAHSPVSPNLHLEIPVSSSTS